MHTCADYMPNIDSSAKAPHKRQRADGEEGGGSDGSEDEGEGEGSAKKVPCICLTYELSSLMPCDLSRVSSCVSKPCRHYAQVLKFSELGQLID
jgi:hypothetical protein